ncbi:abortive infection family protein [Kribbella sp. VKM Ac-2566]|uniref:abortive infection family protein n=1 Tax=Kribbella sp. VKM Ac-2566 TaxID=2512218 RepID=UPI00192E2D3C|nr:abortive infection family protein [Kribbella sp. VKM Ac-2566]
MINSRARVAIRELMSGTVLREIDTMWQDEGFAPPDPIEPVGGERVTRFQEYLNQVDWTDVGHVTRALRVFEVALAPLISPPSDWELTPRQVSQLERVRKLLARDNYTLTEDGRIIGGPIEIISPPLLSGLTDPQVIHEHLDRITAALERDDPAQVIGSAKELVESTAKVVLRQCGVPVNEKDDLPALVKQAQEALAVHPGGVSVGADGADGVKKILGGAITITTSIAELRNRGYGTGHGPGQARTGLSARHARLALHGARTWCEFMLDTLADANAPWRTRQASHGGDMTSS